MSWLCVLLAAAPVLHTLRIRCRSNPDCRRECWLKPAYPIPPSPSLECLSLHHCRVSKRGRGVLILGVRGGVLKGIGRGDSELLQRRSRQDGGCVRAVRACVRASVLRPCVHCISLRAGNSFEWVF